MKIQKHNNVPDIFKSSCARAIKKAYVNKNLNTRDLLLLFTYIPIYTCSPNYINIIAVSLYLTMFVQLYFLVFSCMSISISAFTGTVCNIDSKEKTESNPLYVNTFLASKAVLHWDLRGCITAAL